MNRRVKQVVKLIFLSSLSGALLVLAFPHPSVSWLAWVAMVPFLVALYRATSFRQAVLSGFAFGLIFSGGLLYWILIFGKLAFSSATIYMTFYLCLFAGGAWFIVKEGSSWQRLFLISAWWTAMELVRSFGLWGYSWGILGLSQQNLIFLQLSKLIGGVGLSYAIVLVNLLLVEIWEGRQNLKSIVREIIATIIILVLVFGVGLMLLGREVKGRLFEVAAVQANIAQEQKFDLDYKKKVEKTYLELTRQAAQTDPYLIVWPESAIPGYLRDEPGYQQDLSKLARESGSYLLIGSLDFRDGRYYNSAFLMSPQGSITGRYDKLHVAPWGEFVPWRSVLGRIRALEVIQEDLSAGEKPVVFKTEAGKFSVLICSESVEPFPSRWLICKGAEILVVITNDAWFGRTAVARQHLELTRLRAVENGVYTVQVANTGLSAIIDPWGRIEKVTSLLQKKVLIGKISFIRRPTFYTRAGDVFAYLCLIGTLGEIVRLKWWGKRKIS